MAESGHGAPSRGGAIRRLLPWIVASLAVNFLVSGGALIYLRQLYGTEQLTRSQAELFGIAALIAGPLVGIAIAAVAAWRLLRNAGTRNGGS